MKSKCSYSLQKKRTAGTVNLFLAMDCNGLAVPKTVNMHLMQHTFLLEKLMKIAN